MLVIDNLETADVYSRELTLESKFGGRLVYVVANASARARFRPLLEHGGSDTAEYGPETLVTPQSTFIDKISGVQFRSAIAGTPARIVAQLSEPGDILPASGTPFTQTLAAAGGTTGVPSPPIGAIIAYGGSSDPSGWLICDGRAISRTTYADLFAAISTAYGAGDGSTTFNIPDLRGRTAVGLGTQIDVDTLGESEGLALASRSGGRHWHRLRRENDSVLQYGATAGAGGVIGDGFFNAAPLTLFAGASGDDTSTRSPEVVPYQVVNYIIATGV